MKNCLQNRRKKEEKSIQTKHFPQFCVEKGSCVVHGHINASLNDMLAHGYTSVGGCTWWCERSTQPCEHFLLKSYSSQNNLTTRIEENIHLASVKGTSIH